MNKISLIALCGIIATCCAAQSKLEQINKEISKKIETLHIMSAEARKQKNDLDSDLISNILFTEGVLYAKQVDKFDASTQNTESQATREGFADAAMFIQNTLHGIYHCQTRPCSQEKLNALNRVVDYVISEKHQQELDQLLN